MYQVSHVQMKICVTSCTHVSTCNAHVSSVTCPHQDLCDQLNHMYPRASYVQVSSVTCPHQDLCDQVNHVYPRPSHVQVSSVTCPHQDLCDLYFISALHITDKIQASVTPVQCVSACAYLKLLPRLIG